MLIMCKVANREFSRFEEQGVIWSSDTLPVCPFCRKSPYERDFQDTHTDRAKES